jgi:hypothetical protein
MSFFLHHPEMDIYYPVAKVTGGAINVDSLLTDTALRGLFGGHPGSHVILSPLFM